MQQSGHSYMTAFQLFIMVRAELAPTFQSAVSDTCLGQEQGLAGGCPPANHEA